MRKANETQIWLERRLRVEPDPALILQIREMLAQMARIGAAKPSGWAYQESRLPKPDGPPDCILCHAVFGPSVPMKYQKLFEEGLSRTGLPPEEVWKMPEYHSPVVGKGRGHLAISRARHADHVELYPDWRDSDPRVGR